MQPILRLSTPLLRHGTRNRGDRAAGTVYRRRYLRSHRRIDLQLDRRSRRGFPGIDPRSPRRSGLSPALLRPSQLNRSGILRRTGRLSALITLAAQAASDQRRAGRSSRFHEAPRALMPRLARRQGRGVSRRECVPTGSCRVSERGHACRARMQPRRSRARRSISRASSTSA